MNEFSFISCIGNNRIPPITETNCSSLEIRYSGVQLYVYKDNAPIWGRCRKGVDITVFRCFLASLQDGMFIQNVFV